MERQSLMRCTWNTNIPRRMRSISGKAVKRRRSIGDDSFQMRPFKYIPVRDGRRMTSRIIPSSLTSSKI